MRVLRHSIQSIGFRVVNCNARRLREEYQARRQRCAACEVPWGLRTHIPRLSPAAIEACSFREFPPLHTRRTKMCGLVKCRTGTLPLAAACPDIRACRVSTLPCMPPEAGCSS